MDITQAQELNELNASFYRRVEASFSATRQHPWKGWERVRDHAIHLLPHNLHVLDLACGNLRFEKYLAPEFDSLHTWAVDNCDELVHETSLPNISFQHLDIIQTMLDGKELAAQIDAPLCDLAACFGFMHHVALPEHRQQVLRALVSHTRPGGIVAVSFWQFSRDLRILGKAEPLEDEGDYLLGWQNQSDAHRYCHNFSDGEIDALVASAAPQAYLLDRFSADGKNDDLNCYVVLEVGHQDR